MIDLLGILNALGVAIPPRIRTDYRAILLKSLPGCGQPAELPQLPK
jgi:hypothetical protein